MQEKKISSLRNHGCFKTVGILMRFIGAFQRESCRKPLPLSTTGWLAQLGERRFAEREFVVSNPGRTNTQGLK